MRRAFIIDVNKVDKQLTHAMHVKIDTVLLQNGTFIDKLTKWHQ